LPATAARARVILLLEPELRSAYLDAAAWADCVLCFAHQPEIFRAAARIVKFPTARHEPSPGAQILPLRPVRPISRDGAAPGQETRIPVLFLPRPVEPVCLPNGFEPIGCADEGACVIVLTEANAATLIAEQMGPAAAAVVPVIDASHAPRATNRWLGAAPTYRPGRGVALRRPSMRRRSFRPISDVCLSPIL
jgi:hypothetical protein